MADQWNDRAWALVRALAAVELSLAPEVALRVFGGVREQAVALVAARDGYSASAQGVREPVFGLGPTLGQGGGVNELEGDMTIDPPIPLD